MPKFTLVKPKSYMWYSKLSVVICFLSQLQKLDDIAIVDEERNKAEKKLSGNYDEEAEPENNNN